MKYGVIGTAVAVALALTFTPSAIAQPKSKAEIQKACQTAYGGQSNYQKRTRTGMTVASCIAQGGPK